MSNEQNPNPAPPSRPAADAPSPVPRLSAWRRILFFLKFLEIRMRFVAILLVTALVVGYWDHVQNYFERWQRHRAEASGQVAAPVAESDTEYFCPMHTFVVRTHPDKCPICGMELSKRVKGAGAQLPTGTIARVQVSPQRIMQAGVKTDPVLYRLLVNTVRSYGVIETDETRVARIVARFPGRVDDLMVNSVGLEVKKDEPLARIYSPKFLAAAQEYLQAIASSKRTEGDSQASADDRRRAASLTDFARRRLALAGFTGTQLDALAASGHADETVTLFSPLAGTVLQKSILLGEIVEEGTVLYSIADLSSLWVQALVAEADLASVQLGMPVEVTTVAAPGKVFYGTVDFIYPEINPDSRSGKVRIVVGNADRQLRPGMFVTATVEAPVGRRESAGDEASAGEKVAASAAPAAGKAAASTAGKAAGGKAAAGKTVAAAATSAPSTSSLPSILPVSPASAAQMPALPTKTKPDADTFLATVAAGAEYYVCPMHAEVVSNKPGDCPKCGMHLAKTTKPVAAAPAAKAAAGSTTTAAATAQMPALPTQTKAEANRFFATLTRGAEYYVCPMHPEVVSNKADDCPKCGMHLEKAAYKPVAGPAEAVSSPDIGYTEQWAEGWACPMHLAELSPEPGICRVCPCGMQTQKWRIQRVLSVPESAVIDTGTRMIVYEESTPGVYDAHQVSLGRRAGTWYPVLDGLELNQKIVTRGAFLIDAEARLNPAAATAGVTTGTAAAAPGGMPGM